jgi:hypothetical protein
LVGPLGFHFHLTEVVIRKPVAVGRKQEPEHFLMDNFCPLQVFIALQNVLVHTTHYLGEVSDDVKPSHHAVLFKKGTEAFFREVSEFYDSVGLKKNPLHKYLRQNKASYE